MTMATIQQQISLSEKRRQRAMALQPQVQTSMPQVYDETTTQGQVYSTRQQLQQAKTPLQQFKSQYLFPKKRERAFTDRRARAQVVQAGQGVAEQLGQIQQQEQAFEREVATKAPEYALQAQKQQALMEAKQSIQTKIDDLQSRIQSKLDSINRYEEKERTRKDYDAGDKIERLEDDIDEYRAELREYQRGLGLGEDNLIKQHFSGYIKEKAKYEANREEDRNRQRQEFNKLKLDPKFQDTLKTLNLNQNVSLNEFESAVKKYNNDVAYKNQLLKFAEQKGGVQFLNPEQQKALGFDSQGFDYYKTPQSGYVDPRTGRVIEMSINDDYAKSMGYLPVQIQGINSKTGEYIISSSTSLLTPQQRRMYDLFLQNPNAAAFLGFNINQSASLPTEFVLKGSTQPVEYQKPDYFNLLGKPSGSAYEAATRMDPFTTKELKSMEILRKYGYTSLDGNRVLGITDNSGNFITFNLPETSSKRINLLSEINSYEQYKKSDNIISNRAVAGYEKRLPSAYFENPEEYKKALYTSIKIDYEDKKVKTGDSALSGFLKATAVQDTIRRLRLAGWTEQEIDNYSPILKEAKKGLGDPDIKKFYRAVGTGSMFISPTFGAATLSVLDVMDYEDKLKLDRPKDIAKPSIGEIATVAGTSFATNLVMAKLIGGLTGKIGKGITGIATTATTKAFGKTAGAYTQQASAVGFQGLSNYLTGSFYRSTATELYSAGRQYSIGNKYTALLSGTKTLSGLAGFYAPNIYKSQVSPRISALRQRLNRITLTEVTFNEPGRGLVKGYVVGNVPQLDTFKSGKRVVKQVDINKLKDYQAVFNPRIGRIIYIKRVQQPSIKKPSTWKDYITGKKAGQIKEVRFQKKGEILLKDTPSQLSDPLTQIMLPKKGEIILTSVAPGTSAFGRKKRFQVKEMPGLSTILRSFSGGVERGFFLAPQTRSGRAQAYSYYAGIGKQKGTASLYDYLSGGAKVASGRPSIIATREKVSDFDKRLLTNKITNTERKEVKNLLDSIRRGEWVDKGLTIKDADRLLNKYGGIDQLALHRRLAIAFNVPGRIVPGVGALSGLRTEYEAIATTGTKFTRFASRFKSFIGGGDYKIFLPKERATFDVVFAKMDKPVETSKQVSKAVKDVITRAQKSSEDNFLVNLVATERAAKEASKRALDHSRLPIYSPRPLLVNLPGQTIPRRDVSKKDVSRTSRTSYSPLVVSVRPSTSIVSKPSTKSSLSLNSIFSSPSRTSSPRSQRPSTTSLTSYKSPPSRRSSPSIVSPPRRTSGGSTKSPPPSLILPPSQPSRMSIQQKPRQRPSQQPKPVRRPQRYNILPTITQQIYRVRRKGGKVKRPTGFELIRV